MTETIPVRVQHKRMSASAWASSPLVLLDGELGVESDTGKVKVGNGRDRFSALQYLTGPKGDRGERGEQGPRGADGVMRFEQLTSQQRESLRGPAGPRGADGARGPQGPAGQNIVNQNGGQLMKYWYGSRYQYDSLPYKDPNTIYDVY